MGDGGLDITLPSPPHLSLSPSYNLSFSLHSASMCPQNRSGRGLWPQAVSESYPSSLVTWEERWPFSITSIQKTCWRRTQLAILYPTAMFWPISDQRTQPGLWVHPCGSEVGPVPQPPNWGAVLDWKSSKMGGSEKCLDIQGIGCECLEVLFKDNRGVLELPVRNQQQHRSLRELLNACLEMFIKII